MKDIVEQFFGTRDLGEYAILSCFDRLDDFRRIFKERVIHEFSGYYQGLNVLVENTTVSIIYTGSGDSRVGDAVLAIRDSPVKVLLYTGTAGGISANLQLGDWVAAEEAVIGEGFSRYYRSMAPGLFDNKAAACRELVSLFKEYVHACRPTPRAVHYAALMTVESVFAETEELFQEAERSGCWAIDMETSAFYTAAEVVGRKALAVHFISDLPRLEKDYSLFKKACIKSYVEMPRVLLKFMEYLVSQAEGK